MKLFLAIGTAAIAIAMPSNAAEIAAPSSKMAMKFDTAYGAKGKKMGNMGQPHINAPKMRHDWGKKVNGRWFAGYNAPGGWNAYSRPTYGFIMPRYWVNPSFYIVNYSRYGLTQPTNGYYWSRYYDDAVLADNQGRVYDYRSNIAWDKYDDGYEDGYQNGYGAGYQDNAPVYQPQYNPNIAADPRVYGQVPAGSSTEAGVYEGSWTGRYVDPENQVYRGQWDGTYTNEDGQVYEGTYSGTMVGDPYYQAGTGQSSPPQYGYSGQQQGQYQGQYGAPYQNNARPAPVNYDRSFDGYERCKRDNGIGGAVIGGVIGGVAGNRIAGKGKRLGGTLIGGGLGAIAGSAIDKASQKCEQYRPAPQPQYQPAPQYYPAPQPQYPQQSAYPAQTGQTPAGYGWSQGQIVGGYVANGYYYPGVYYPPQQNGGTTTIIIDGGQSTTTTVTEEYVYETVRAAPKKRYVAPKRKYTPKPKPKCSC
ncbi:hypothetical protein LPB140_10930 [Sphingorhabdus lutea]|uniref:17 kDa surface antigen n=2 Tax=Sphingorhabdus lutea TaxID=1913578 RepID=A0A1L3JDL5_9SPHN|nr:hypothetical protein LPB140_10930 [Sphingorhabdus lutea]